MLRGDAHVTAKRQTPSNDMRPSDDRIIPFRGLQSPRLHHLPTAVVPVVARARTLRPVDILMLLPIIAPLVVAILLGLLGWFVAWLVTVGLLVTAIVVADLMRAVCGRLNPSIRTLDRQAIG
jgi:hypothetical protein